MPGAREQPQGAGVSLSRVLPKVSGELQEAERALGLIQQSSSDVVMPDSAQ